MSQMKTRNKIRARDLSKMEICSMSETEFKAILIKILASIQKRVQGLYNTLHQETGNVKRTDECIFGRSKMGKEQAA